MNSKQPATEVSVGYRQGPSRLCAIVAVTLSLLLIAAGCGSDDDDPATITTNLFAGAVLALPQIVAEERGFYAEQGLTVENVNVVSGPQATTALISGDIDIMINGPEYLVLARGQGQDLISVGAIYSSGTAAIVVRSDIERPNANQPFPANAVDLEGLTIGVTARGAASEFYIRAAADAAGIDPDSITYVATGGVGTTMAALESKQIDGWLGFEPGISICVYQLGLCDIIADFRTGVGPAQIVDSNPAVMITTQSYLDDNQDVADRFVRAIGKAIDWMADPANTEALEDIVVEHLAPPAEVVERIVADNANTFGILFEQERYENTLGYLADVGIIEDVPPYSEAVIQLGGS